MTHARTMLALGLLVWFLAACQSASIADPMAPPETLPAPSADMLQAISQIEATSTTTVDPQQYLGCHSVVSYYGYDGCWRYTAGLWNYAWPYGYSLPYCWFIIYYESTGQWGSWNYTQDWDMCNV